MTKAEAIKYIKARCIGSAEKRDGTQWSDAMWTAIEALTQDSRKVTQDFTQDLISRQDAIDAAIEAVDEWDGGYNRTRESMIENALKALPSADRPTGKVDAVAIYEKAEHDLEHNKITLGEYEKRIEPLKHLYYDRPTGEWVSEDGTPSGAAYSVYCSRCGQWSEYRGFFCLWCGAKMGGDTE